MKHIQGRIYKRTVVEQWVVPNTGKWQGEETPALVTLERLDDPSKVIMVSKEDFENNFEDTGEDKPIEGSATFD